VNIDNGFLLSCETPALSYKLYPLQKRPINTRVINWVSALLCLHILDKLCFCLADFLLFIGSITAIINFHSDVDMKQAHKAIYRVITGIETDKLLLIQIPYSLGIGAGMSVFFNHVFNKKINKEPTPLEMEIHTYQQGVDKYIKNNSVKG
jgi:hypothetical protein